LLFLGSFVDFPPRGSMMKEDASPDLAAVASRRLLLARALLIHSLR
jgi:hypothetical protein